MVLALSLETAVTATFLIPDATSLKSISDVLQPTLLTKSLEDRRRVRRWLQSGPVEIKFRRSAPPLLKERNEHFQSLYRYLHGLYDQSDEVLVSRYRRIARCGGSRTMAPPVARRRL